jgi:hypothetical protein
MLCAQTGTLEMGWRVSKEKRESSHWEKSGKELGLGLTSQNNLHYSQIFVDYFRSGRDQIMDELFVQEKVHNIFKLLMYYNT